MKTVEPTNGKKESEVRKRIHMMGMITATLGTALATVLAGGVSSQPAGASLPSTVTLYDLQDASGAAGAVGVADENGMKLAVEKINSEHLLGSTKLAVTYADDATSPTTSASLATGAISAHYPIVIGPPSSSVAIADAPIFARAGQPTIFTQAGGPGTVLNKDIFRLTPLQTDRIPAAFGWLESQKVKTVAVLQDSDFPTEVALANETKADGPKYGFKVTATDSILAAQSDIASEVSKLVSSGAQAVALDVLVTQNATAATELRQGGFKGQIIAEDGAGGGALKGAGAAANGIVWASDWVPGAPTGATSDAFTKAYTAAYGIAPNDWAAESYDAGFYAARALKAAGSTTPAAVDSALIAEGKKGYDGVLGQAKVVNGQEQAKADLVQWENGAAVSLANQNPK
jgi:branched-chain amino acid transport system substrate-binding protein